MLRGCSRLVIALAATLACGGLPGDGEGGEGSSSESSPTTTGESTGFTSAPDLELPGDGDEEGDGDGDGDGDETPACNPEAFVFAPAPIEVDGLPAVPIDILELDAVLRFNLATSTASAGASLRFALGEAGGMPLFDLRQTPDTLVLDGRPIDSSLLARHDFGVGWDYGFLILEVALEPCTVHQLELDYPVFTPQARLAEGPKFVQDPARVYFDLFASDLDPGRFLESWLPANMPWDRHPISLAVRLDDAGATHALISNASVDELGPHQWQLEFPATTTAMDPMLVVIPIDELDSQTGVHQAQNGQSIPYAVHVDTQVATSSALVATNLGSYLDEFVTSVGEYGHPELTVYIYPTLRSMEYAGATTSALVALEHEVFHSWWARGLSPASYADGWIDEAWTMFNTGPQAFVPVAFDWSAGPWKLFDSHPFARDTPHAAYQEGRLLFAGLADLLGVEPLRAMMAELYAQQGPLGFITTAQLERHLHCASGELAELRQAFHRFVHGLYGDVGPVDDGYCG